ncbi:hypothetical protein V1478_017869, partial [Vespula squamosa]
MASQKKKLGGNATLKDTPSKGLASVFATVLWNTMKMSSDRLASLIPRLERGGRFTRREGREGGGGGGRKRGGRGEHERRSDQ